MALNLKKVHREMRFFYWVANKSDVFN